MMHGQKNIKWGSVSATTRALLRGMYYLFNIKLGVSMPTHLAGCLNSYGFDPPAAEFSTTWTLHVVWHCMQRKHENLIFKEICLRSEGGRVWISVQNLYKHVSNFGRLRSYRHFLIPYTPWCEPRLTEPAGGWCTQLGGLSFALQALCVSRDSRSSQPSGSLFCGRWWHFRKPALSTDKFKLKVISRS